ncbi:MAG: hypothetical protein LBS43_01595 [Prevotellaceae bacterium]|jgi:hypothetical protein|nr:hypothetical protein [Prevotellaceae bacterium]
MKLFILTAILLALSVAGLGVRIWIKGEFTENDTGRNKNMKKLGIRCVKDEEMELHNNIYKSHNACSGCSFLEKCAKSDLQD